MTFYLGGKEASDLELCPGFSKKAIPRSSIPRTLSLNPPPEAPPVAGAKAQAHGRSRD